VRVLIICLLFVCAQCQLKQQLSRHINNMVTGPAGVDHLVSWGAVFGHHYHRTIGPSQIGEICGVRESLPHIGAAVTPFDRFRGLQFGRNLKIQALQFTNQIGGNANGRIISNAIMGVRNGDSIEVVSAYGGAVVSPKQQYNTQKVQKCKRILFIKKCHDETIRVPRGFTHGELEAVIKEAERRAAVAMRQNLGFGSELVEEESLGLSSPFISEHDRLRALYPEIEYQYNDYNEVELGQWNGALHHGFNGRADQGIRDRVNQFLQSHGHSNFLLAATNVHLYYLIVHKNSNGTFNLHVSLFTVGGGKTLPTGAFATSVGGWSLERGGQGANPSIHQVMSIFGYK